MLEDTNSLDGAHIVYMISMVSQNKGTHFFLSVETDWIDGSKW